MLLNTRSLKKPNAAYHLSCDITSLCLKMCFITETWLTHSIDNSFVAIPYFTIFRQDRNNVNSSKSIGGGVCAYIHIDISCQQLYPDDCQHFEILWLDININSLYYLFCVVYYPPDAKNEKELSSHIILTSEKLFSIKQYSDFVLIGDFNHFRAESVTEQTSLIDLNLLPTYGSKVLDKVFSIKRETISRIYTHKATVSTDHLGVVCDLKITATNNQVIYFRDQREKYKRTYFSVISNFNFSHVFNSNTVDDALSSLNFILYSTFEHCCPLRKVTIRSSDPDYVTPLIKILLKKKNKLFRKGRIREANTVGTQIREKIKENYRYLEKVGSKSWWSKVNNLVSDRKKSVSLDFDVEELNNFYNSFSFTDSHSTVLNDISLPDTIPFFTPFEVFFYLNNIHKSASEKNGLPFWIFKLCASFLAEPVCSLFNISLKTKEFPSTWKIANIIPLPKVTSPKVFKDLRPLSLTPILSRVFERMVYDKYVRQAYQKSLSSYQFGFRKRSSTTFALIKMLNEIMKLKQSNDYCRILTLDMSKAFDTIFHSAIYSGLGNLSPNLNSFVLQWYKNFLTNRSHYTTIGNSSSSVKPINLGVPQGTISGPILFNLSVDDTYTSGLTDNCYLSAYADDNTPVIPGLYSKGDNAHSILMNLEKHFASKNLKLNTSKTFELLINFGKSDVPCIPSVERKDNVKILGVTFDKKLNFAKHINNMVMVANRKVYLLLKLKRLGFTKQELILLYKSLVLSSLTYCASVWGGAASCHLDKIDNVQRKAVRLGLISTFVPIMTHISISDSKIYQQIMNDNSHILRDIIPLRTEYAANMLRPRYPPVARAKSEQELSIFPHRLLRTMID